MRYIRYLFLGVLGLCLLTVAIANRGPVTLRLFTDEIAAFVGFAPEVTLPLFIVIFGSMVVGLLIGFVWEWLREHRIRATAVTERRERVRLEHEVKKLRGPEPQSGDDVLAILDEGAATR